MSLDDELEAFFDQVDDVVVQEVSYTNQQGESDDVKSAAVFPQQDHPDKRTEDDYYGGDDGIDQSESIYPHKRLKTTFEDSSTMPVARKAIVASSAPTINIKPTETIQSISSYVSKQSNNTASSMISTSYYGTIHPSTPSFPNPMMATMMQPQTHLGQEQYHQQQQLPTDPNAKGKSFKRVAAGQTWEDPTLADFPENDFRIFVGNLGKEISDAKLAEAFSGRYPSFVMARVVFDKATKQSKGYGFVSFLDPSDCARAIREMDKSWIGGRPIQVKLSEWKTRDLKEVRKNDRKSKGKGR